MKCVTFDPARHLDGVLRLSAAEGWLSLSSDGERARRALTAPGVVTVVAVDNDEVIGFAQMLTDGEIEAYLCVLVVAAPARGCGIGKALVAEAFQRSGTQRIDVLSLVDSTGFYERFRHRAMSGYRIYPSNG